MNRLNFNSENIENKLLRKAWLVCLTASLFFFYSTMLSNFFNAFSLQLFRDLGINSTQLGFFFASYLWAYFLCLIPAGILLDHFPVRKILLSATAIAVFLTVMLSQISALNSVRQCAKLLAKKLDTGA